MIQTVLSKSYYDNTKVCTALDFKFRAVEESLAYVTDLYKSEHGK